MGKKLLLMLIQADFSISTSEIPRRWKCRCARACPKEGCKLWKQTPSDHSKKSSSSLHFLWMAPSSFQHQDGSLQSQPLLLLVAFFILSLEWLSCKVWPFNSPPHYVMTITTKCFHSTCNNPFIGKNCSSWIGWANLYLVSPLLKKYPFS